MNIAVLGAGAWGTALAIQFARKHNIRLWGRNSAHMAELAEERRNQKYLPDAPFPPALTVCTTHSDALTGADLCLIVTSTSGLADTISAVHQLAPTMPILWACKGFDRATGKLPHETIAQLATANLQTGALSGPSFADEVARGLPCALTLASTDATFAHMLATELSGNALRVYSSQDVIGVELGGALKNVMAIAAGLADGMALGLNARAALITRGLAEMVRLGVAMGGRPETFMGLTGMGDLILTATGNLSRNRKVGMLLAEGRTLADVLANLGHVAEGVNSAATTLALARRHSISMPITEAVNAVLFDNADPKAAVAALLARETRAE
jgi:glycerol-3-phosphate dehydrogenase (NAD(P)+)